MDITIWWKMKEFSGNLYINLNAYDSLVYTNTSDVYLNTFTIHSGSFCGVWYEHGLLENLQKGEAGYSGQRIDYQCQNEMEKS